MDFEEFKKEAAKLGVDDAIEVPIVESKEESAIEPEVVAEFFDSEVEAIEPVQDTKVFVEDYIAEAVSAEVLRSQQSAAEFYEKQAVGIFEAAKDKKVASSILKSQKNKVKEEKKKIGDTASYITTQVSENATLEYAPSKGNENFQREVAKFKTSVDKQIKSMFTKEVNNFRKIAEMSSGGGGNESRSIQNASDIATLSADVGAFQNVTQSQRDEFQGYIALLSPVYFGGNATTFDIALEDVNQFLDIELEVDPAGEFDHRVTSMTDAQASGYTGTGADGDPIIFLLEGLELTSSADVRVSMSFNPDDDGGRLDSRLNFFRHSGTTPSDNFHIEASSIAMESGAEEDYAYTPDIKFFIGDTIDTNAPGDAGRVCFQIKSDVPGTVTINEIAMFIQK